MSTFSHLDAEGRARMVDVSAKIDSSRTAVAAGEFVTTPEVVTLVRADGLPKADVLATARIAGIAGAKKTSELIPLCHQLALSSVSVRFDFTDTAITIEATAKTKGPTGVEMEALTAVAVAGLTLHDMVKAVDPAATLTNVRLLTKDGGKHGHWQRETAVPATAPAKRSATVLVASTAAAAGSRTDTTGPQIADWLRERGFAVRGPLVHADADIAAGLADALSDSPALVLTTGGTGASPTDATPEATRAVIDRELPGIAEAIRQRGAAAFPLASLSRGIAGLVGRTVVVNLPGSPGGVRDGLAVLEPMLDHLLDQVAGGGRHD
ncbi:bifunctional molybdenum cofactor biosynthesis protein MoaC/MoaB [Skermania sp. ID1734]|uniref:bifunctional molybdenum cofactor biosynthesis protein MoaC/MoaB n=1 Tax=Skermania sp. ID1734 TaxID=2597516 RepID=UPI00117FEBED|nr:bifunctional molybdenum cofactor biosynthesis protein MoaC/MoaB [Skermania sp. ID1734]TSE00967.1 bifunctional molybdenum cofactor biosynthesis protein MoaC/MoaB [Skermania sp. ID1734]